MATGLDNDPSPPGDPLNPPTNCTGVRSGGSGRRRNAGAPDLRTIITDDGVRWLDYRKSLRPRYAVVWRDLASCYLLLALGVAAPVIGQLLWGRWWSVAIAVPAAVWSGYWLHALCLYGHEAAHANLAASHAINDVLGDWLVWVLFGSTTRHYRRTHMQHHVHLGDHRDTEISYIRCLSVTNLVEAMTGIYLVEVLLRKRSQAQDSRAETPEGARLASLRSAILHAAVVLALAGTGYYPAALTWVLATLCFFPLFAMVRTTLEHRRIDAGCEIDFTIEEHGAINRLFGEGLFARTFGAAGFNHHLLHHWDPAISYTRLTEMRTFLERTPLSTEIRNSKTSYLLTLRAMLLEARRG